MNTATISATLAELKDALADRPADPASPPWLAARRGDAAELFGRLDFPQRCDEAWRYTAVDTLLTQPFAADAPGPEPLPSEYALTDSAACRLVLVNGRYRPELSELGPLPAGAQVGSLGDALAHRPEALEPWLGQAAPAALHSFSALNTAYLQDGLFLYLPANQVIDQPIEVLHLGSRADQALLSHPHNLVVLEAHAQATLIERYCGEPGAVFFHNGVTQLHLNDGAHLDHHRLQQQSAGAWHLDSLSIDQQRDSRYRGTLYSLGGRWARHEVHAALRGEGAEFELSGAGTVGRGQLNDLHLNVEHQAPHCRSHSAYRGLLHGSGRAVFDGRILVAEDAQHSDAQLNNANLLLAAGAEIDTKPVLEIHADDVRCSHGATVGRIDPQQLFYLRSRGIDPVGARRMLAIGFAATTLDRCPIDQLRGEVERDIAERLGATDGEA